MLISDRILPGVIIGLLADVVKLTVNYISFLLNFTRVVFWQITASRFLPEKDLYSPVAYLIGGMADLTISAAFGVLFVYLIYFFGPKHLWLKGIGFALLVWVLIFGSLLGQSVAEKLPQDPSGIVVTLAAHIFYGLALAFFTGLLHRKLKM